MPWIVLGNFAKKSGAGIFISRELKLQNTAEEARISEVHLLKYANKRYQLILHAKNESSYLRLVAQVRSLGFAEPDYLDKKRWAFRLSCDHLIPHAAAVMQLVHALDSSFIEMKATVEQLGIDLEGHYPIPPWYSMGSFKHVFDWGWGVNRLLEFKSVSPEATIRELSFIGYARAGYQVMVQAADRASYELLVDYLLSKGLAKPDSSDKERCTYRLMSHSLTSYQLASVLSGIHLLDPHFTMLNPIIEEELAIVLDEGHTPRRVSCVDTAAGGAGGSTPVAATHGFFSEKETTTAIAMPHWSFTDSNNTSFLSVPTQRKLEFKNSSRAAKIKELVLLGTSSGSFELVLHAANSLVFDDLVAHAKHSGLPRPDLSESHLGHFKIYCLNPRVHGTPLIMLLRKVDKHCNAIERQLIHALNIELPSVRKEEFLLGAR